MSTRPTRRHTVNLYSDELGKLEAEAALHGFNSTDAINQAVQLWNRLAGYGLIGQRCHVEIVSEPVNRTSWQRFWDLLLSRVQKNTFWITLSGDSPDIAIDETIRRIREQDD